MASLTSFVRCSRCLFAIGLIAQLMGCYSDPSPTTTASSAPAASGLAVDGSIDKSTAAETVQPPNPATALLQGEGRKEPETSNVSIGSMPLQRGTKPEAEAMQKAEPKPPLHLEEIMQRIDMRKFAFMAGSSRTWPGVEHYGFSGAVSESFTVDSVMKFLDKVLMDAGCVRGTDPNLESHDATGAERMYWLGDLMLSASCGISRGASGPDINAGIHILGNVDIQTLPTPPNVTISLSKPNSLKLSSSQEILELRKFYSNAFRELGWIEFRDYLPGISIPVDDQLPHQSFLMNAIYVSFYYRESDGDDKSKGKFVASARSGILEYEPTLPGDARSVQLRQRSPIAMAYETKLSPHDLRAFYDEAYAAQGYSFDNSPTGTEDKEFKVMYSHPNKNSLTIESKRLNITTIVVANGIK